MVYSWTPLDLAARCLGRNLPQASLTLLKCNHVVAHNVRANNVTETRWQHPFPRVPVASVLSSERTFLFCPSFFYMNISVPNIKVSLCLFLCNNDTWMNFGVVAFEWLEVTLELMLCRQMDWMTHSSFHLGLQLLLSNPDHRVLFDFVFPWLDFSPNYIGDCMAERAARMPRGPLLLCHPRTTRFHQGTWRLNLWEIKLMSSDRKQRATCWEQSQHFCGFACEMPLPTSCHAVDMDLVFPVRDFILVMSYLLWRTVKGETLNLQITGQIRVSTGQIEGWGVVKRSCWIFKLVKEKVPISHIKITVVFQQ